MSSGLAKTILQGTMKGKEEKADPARLWDTCWTSARKKISGVTRPPDWRSEYDKEVGY